MSRIEKTDLEPVEVPKRPHLSAEAKRAIHERVGGVCWLCTKPVPLDGPEVEYDHRNQRSVSADDSHPNIWPMHKEPCHRLKTAADARDRAKVYRINRKHNTPRSEWPKAQKIGGGKLRGRQWGEP